MAELSSQLNKLESALNTAFEQHDWDEFLELDSTLQEVLAGYKAIGEFPNKEQIKRIHEQYKTMRTFCMKHRLHLSKKMETMRQKKGALSAYSQCAHAGNF